MFVDWQWPTVRRGDAIPVAVHSLHQPMVPGRPTGIQHRVLELRHQVNEDNKAAERHNKTTSSDNVLGLMV